MKSSKAFVCGLCLANINSFEQLNRQFVAHFISSRRHHHSSDTLIGIKQQTRETLRDYIDGFKAATLEISDLDQVISMSSIKDGPWPSKFLFSLEKKFPFDFIEILA